MSNQEAKVQNKYSSNYAWSLELLGELNGFNNSLWLTQNYNFIIRDLTQDALHARPIFQAPATDSPLNITGSDLEPASTHQVLLEMAKNKQKYRNFYFSFFSSIKC